MKYPWATAGRKVVCVKPISYSNYFKNILPELNKTYTIRRVSAKCNCDPAFVLSEIKNEARQLWCTSCSIAVGIDEIHFSPTHFKPLDDRQTDISDLIKIANDVGNLNKIMEKV